MKTFFKLLLYGFLGFIGIVLIAAIVIPVFFKDDIKQSVDDQIAKSVNAKVFYDAESFGVSLFSDFPHVSVSLEKFGVVGKDDFKRDTLISAGSFNIVIDIMSLFGDKMNINKVQLEDANINGIVNKLGKANWDIMIPTDEQPDTSKSKPLNLEVDEWIISNANITYDDQISNMYLSIKNMNHTGSGKISEVFDLSTSTQIESITYTMDGTSYLSNNKLDAEIGINIDLAKSKYTFLDNKIRLNDFAFGFEGFVAMPDSNSIDMDVKYRANETEFRNILSLIPGIFMSGFEEIKTDGKLAFDGFVKGKMEGDKIPSFGFNLKVTNGMFQYPDLPTPVKNIHVDLAINNADGILNNTIINLKKMHMDMGSNPVDAKILLKGFSEVVDVDAAVKARVNLAEVTKFYPVDGMTLKGLFDLNLLAKGQYIENESKMPTIQAYMNLKDGYVKSKDFPAPIDFLSFKSLLTSNGEMSQSKIQVDQFAVLLDGERFEGKFNASNFDNIAYNLDANGRLNLSKLTKLYPLDGMTLTGIIDVNNFHTEGTMADIDAGRYTALKTSGSGQVSDFVFTSTDLPQGFKISKGAMNFTPDKINITELKGYLGKSDIDITGYVSNYMGYMFSEKDSTIRGKMNFNSNVFDVNEWMADEPVTPGQVPAEEVPMEPVQVPSNIDFVMASNIKKALYSNMELTNMLGNIIVKDGVVRMDRVGFNTLGSQFITNGTYDATDIKDPKFDFDLDIKNLSFSKAYETFNTVKALAPAAKNMDGFFSTNFKLTGGLDQEMMPKLNTLTGGGLLNIADAKVKGLAMINSINNLTKMSNVSDEVSLKNVMMKVELKDGKVNVKPFNAKLGNTNMQIQGSNSFDGTIDFLVGMDVPSGAAGQAFSSAVSSLTGNAFDAGNDVHLDIAVKGTNTAPKPSIVRTSLKGGQKPKDVAKQAVTQKATQVKQEVKQQVNQQVEQKKEEVKQQVEQKKEEVKQEVKKEAENKAKEALKGIKKPW